MNKPVLVALALCQALPAHAGNDDRLAQLLSLSLTELMAQEVTISTHTRHALAKAPAVVSVITAEDIQATGATNLAEVLEGVPGIHVRASQFANRPLIHFRGANASQTLLMVNGAAMKDLMWGFGIFWKGLPASMIERIEIIRGPGSALYGADAGAGAINVITRTAGKIEGTEAGARAGSYDTGAAWLRHGGTWNGFDLGLTAELSSTNGYRPFIAEDGQTSRDQTYGTAVSYAPGHAGFGWRNSDIRLSAARDNWRLYADYTRHSDLEIGLTGAGVLDPTTQADDSRYNLDLLYDNERFGRDWGLSAELRYARLGYTSGNGFQERPPGYVDASGLYPDGVINRMRAAERRLNFETSGLYRGLDRHAIRLGIGHVWQDLYSVEQIVSATTAPGTPVDVTDTPNAFAPEMMRRIGYLFAQDIWSLSDTWELTAGARYDHYSDFGATLNPRLALVWQGNDTFTGKLMYGQAFRAPSYQELYSLTSLALPNPDLKPERSRTWDLSLTYAATKDLQVGVDLFHFAQSDLIAIAGTPGQFQNTGDHTIRGVELDVRWQAAKALRIAGNYTWRSQDDSSYRTYAVPDREAYLRADWAFLPRWNWNLQANWVGERPRPPGDSRAAVAAYTLVDTTLRYAPGNRWEFAASVRNLLDADAREYTNRAIPDDLPLPGRNVYAEIRYRFD